MKRCPLVAMTLMACFAAARGWGAEARLPVPEGKAQAAAEASIKSLYKGDFAKGSPTDRAALAAKLMKVADESRNDPAARFALLHQGQELGIQAGDVATVVQADDALAGAFEVDSISVHLAAMVRIAGKVKTQQGNRDLADAATQICEQAIAGDRFDDAAHAAAIVSSAGEKLHDKELISAANQYAGSITRGREAQSGSEHALKVLQSTPTDPGANTTVGKYLCFNRGEWEKGLPYLAHATDAVLAKLAARDLAGATGAGDMQALGNDWWQWASAAEKREAPQGKSRAAFWYGKAMPQLQGLQKSLAERRIDEAANTAVEGKRVVDLMSLIDPTRDAVTGTWTLEGHVLSATNSGVTSRIRIRYEPPLEYDFRIVFVRKSGRDAVAQMVSQERHALVWVMGCAGNNRCGFGVLNGMSPLSNKTTVSAMSLAKAGSTHVSVVKVRRDSLRAFLDGKLIAQSNEKSINWSLEAYWDIRGAAMGLGADRSLVDFSVIELTNMSAGGKTPAAVP